MPKKRRSSVHHHRPKKKKLEQAVTVEDEPNDVEVEEENKSEDRASPGPPAPPAESEPISVSSEPAVCRSVMAELITERDAAMHTLKVVNRRWRKTLLNYFNDHGSLRWATKSELNRVLERLQHADNEHDAAEDYYHHCDIECMRYRTWQTLFRYCNLHLASHAHALARDRARARLNEHRLQYRQTGAAPQPRPDRGIDNAQVVELLCRTVGLAAAYQWLPLDALRSDYADDQEEQQLIADRKEQGKREDVAALRRQIQGFLDAEKTHPFLRFSRSNMLDWSRGEHANAADILRAMGECLCHTPPKSVGMGTCEMCRADRAEASSST